MNDTYSRSQDPAYSDEGSKEGPTNAFLPVDTGRNLRQSHLTQASPAAEGADWEPSQARSKSSLSGKPASLTYDASFKERALTKLDRGQKIGHVAAAMGVGPKTLVRWKRQRAARQTSTCPPADSMPVDPITYTTNVSTQSIHRWTHPPAAPDAMKTIIYSDDKEQQALALLEAGKSVLQVAVALDVQPKLVHRWRSAQQVPVYPIASDGRRLYDDVFKAEALRQISSGVSVRKVSQSMGVSEVTLHKWRKQALAPGPSPTGFDESGSGLVADPADEQTIQQIHRLQKKLTLAESERDILKQAIQILMRPH